MYWRSNIDARNCRRTPAVALRKKGRRAVAYSLPTTRRRGQGGRGGGGFSWNVYCWHVIREERKERTMRKMNESEMRTVDGGRARIVGWKRAPIGQR